MLSNHCHLRIQACLFIYVCLFLSILLLEISIILCFVQSSPKDRNFKSQPVNPHPYLQGSPRGQIAGTLATIVLVELRGKRGTDGWKWSQNDSSGTAGVGGHLPFPTLLLALATCFVKFVFFDSMICDSFFYGGTSPGIFCEALIVLL